MPEPAAFGQKLSLTKAAQNGEAMRYRFNVFGRIIAIERCDAVWAAYLIGDDGKRRPAGLAIPSDVPHDELGQYLYDIYHESATPTNGDVFEIGPAQNT